VSGTFMSLIVDSKFDDAFVRISFEVVAALFASEGCGANASESKAAAWLTNLVLRPFIDLMRSDVAIEFPTILAKCLGMARELVQRVTLSFGKVALLRDLRNILDSVVVIFEAYPSAGSTSPHPPSRIREALKLISGRSSGPFGLALRHGCLAQLLITEVNKLVQLTKSDEIALTKVTQVSNCFRSAAAGEEVAFKSCYHQFLVLDSVLPGWSKTSVEQHVSVLKEIFEYAVAIAKRWESSAVVWIEASHQAMVANAFVHLSGVVRSFEGCRSPKD
jgi:hypothetical protein